MTGSSAAAAGTDVRSARRLGARHGGAVSRRLLDRVGAGPAVGLLIASAAVFHGAFTLTIPAPWIVPDELIYSELAKSLAALDGLKIRGSETAGFAFGYSLVIAPIYAIVGDLAQAYTIVKLANAAIMSLAAIPSYLLARRALGPAEALMVAGLTVAIPSMAYTSVVMTEVLFFPVFLCVVLVMTRALERPTFARQSAVIVAVALASGVRPQALVLFPAFLAAALGQAVLCESEAKGSTLRGGLISVLGRFRVAFVGTALLVALFGFAQFLRGSSALGVYSGVLRNVALTDVPRWLGLQFLDLDLYLGGVPLVLAGVAMIAAIRRRPARPELARLRSFALVTASTALFMFVTVAVFTSNTKPSAEGYLELPPRIHERYLFYLVPLCLILAFAALRNVSSMRTRSLAAAVGLAALLPGLIPFDDLSFNARFETLAILPYSGGDPLRSRLAAVVIAALVALGGLVAARRGRPRAFCVILASYFFLMTLVARGHMSTASEWSRDAGFRGAPTWIDRAVGEHDVVAIWSEEFIGDVERGAAWRLIWENEFFNRRLSTVLQLDEPMPYGLPAIDVAAAESGTIVRRRGGRPIEADYVLAADSLPVEGDVVTRDRMAGMVILRVEGPIRLRARG